MRASLPALSNVLVLSLALVACSGSGGGATDVVTNPDPAADEAPADPGADSAEPLDTAPDVPSIADVAADPGAPDVAYPDAGAQDAFVPDSTIDAAELDTAIDIAPEAGEDTIADTTVVAVPDAAADAASDAVGDVWTDATASLSEAVAAVLTARGIGKMTVLLDESEIEAQAAAYPGPVTFLQAFESALDSFLTDASDPECPLALVEVDELGPCQDGTLHDQLVCYLDDPASTIALVTLDGKPWPPEEGESLAANWVFFLSIHQLSDVLNWAIVDRAGAKATYNYGFN